MAEQKKDKFWAVIAAAGKSSRMAGVDKILVDLMGKPLIAWTLETFEKLSRISGIIVVLSPKNMSAVRKILKKFKFKKIIKIVEGGKERKNSVFNGLCQVKSEFTVIHDGARPLLTEQQLNLLLGEAIKYSNCILGIPIKDTVKIVDNQGLVVKTPPREQLFKIQTPQIFKTDLLLKNYEKILGSDVRLTDDSQVLEKIGVPVKMVPGFEENLKITTPLDLEVARVILQRRTGK